MMEWKQADSLAVQIHRHGMDHVGDPKLESHATTIYDLTEQLSSILNRPVIEDEAHSGW